MLKTLKTNHGILDLPVFFPDATEGFVKAMKSEDLEECGVDGCVTNTYHLMRLDLVDKVEKAGGIQKYMKFNRPFISDSGGFQVYSLIRKKGWGRIYEDGVEFELDGKKTFLTPEECIRVQLKLGTDIIMCLDDCTEHIESREEQEKAVERTIEWGKRCKKEFVRLTEGRRERPLLFGIIQGGNNLDLRKYCADELKKIGFDGYGFGGWSIDENGLMEDLAKFIADQMPDDRPKYAMGIGNPKSLVQCFNMGYNIFDCIVPTREARRQRLYYFKEDPDKLNTLEEKSFDYFSLKNGKYKEDLKPISEFCDCFCCKNYSRAGLKQMFKSRDPLAMRLASIHNLRFYSKMMEVLRRSME